MRIRLRKLLLVLCLPGLLGAAPSRTHTYTTGSTIDSGQVTTNEDNLYAYVQAGVDTYAAGSVNSAAIADDAVGASEIAAGAVVAAALNVRAQAVASRLSGPGPAAPDDVPVEGQQRRGDGRKDSLGRVGHEVGVAGDGDELL